MTRKSVIGSRCPTTLPDGADAKSASPGEILDAALGVFAEKGFAAAKLTEIARRAGVSKAALYLYFETKEDLFRAAVRGLVAPNLAAIAAALEASEAAVRRARAAAAGRRRGAARRGTRRRRGAAW